MPEKIKADLVIIDASEVLTLKGSNTSPRVGKEMKNLGIIANGVVATKKEKIIFVGPKSELDLIDLKSAQVIEASGKIVMPGFVDCHTHLVFAGSREEEFLQKIQGLPYLEILRQGGGILNTVRATQKASFNELFVKAKERIDIALRNGTTTIEIKSGYGLSWDSELKILRVIKALSEKTPLDVVSTFLGAHAFPPNLDRRSYIKEVLKTIKLVSEFNLAEYCDVFCEKEAFSVEETRRILRKAREYGLKLKLHAGEFNDLGGVKLGVELGATSIDHLDYVRQDQIEMMARNKIVGVLLPGVSFHLAKQDYAPARKLIEAGVPVALATDFNPGTSPTLSMQMIIALACRYMKMTPEEAIVASTINSAHALDRADEIGSLEVGKKADIIILNIPSYRQLPYWFGTNLVERVIKKGEILI